MFSLGESPYPGTEAGEELYKKLLEGYRMPQPEFSNEKIYAIMLECWEKERHKRPVS